MSMQSRYKFTISRRHNCNNYSTLREDRIEDVSFLKNVRRPFSNHKKDFIHCGDFSDIAYVTCTKRLRNKHGKNHQITSVSRQIKFLERHSSDENARI